MRVVVPGLGAMREVTTNVSLRADIAQAGPYCNRPCMDGQYANKTVDIGFPIEISLCCGNIVCLVELGVLS